MKWRAVSKYQPISETMVSYIREQIGVDREKRVRVVEHIQTLAPPFHPIRIPDLIVELVRSHRIGIGVHTFAESKQGDPRIVVGTLLAHSVEFAYRAAVTEKYCCIPS